MTALFFGLIQAIFVRTLIITFVVLVVAYLHHHCYLFCRKNTQVNGLFEIRKNIGKCLTVKIRIFSYHVVFSCCHNYKFYELISERFKTALVSLHHDAVGLK